MVDTIVTQTKSPS